MKKIFYSALFLAVVFSSCKDDSIYLAENPVQEGEEIIFGAERTVPENINVIEGDKNTNVSSRTIYGIDENGNYNVYWEKNDSIMIFCPQASQPSTKRVVYSVEPDPNRPNYALSLTKEDLDGAGLQWGQGEGELGEHRFYGIYPASAVKGTTEETSGGKITMNIPVNQPASKWRIQHGKDGKIIYNGLANTDYAYMCAYKSVNKSQVEQGQTIGLHFRPLTTVLEIDINGPLSSEVIVTSINVEQINPDTKLVMTGDFVCEMKKTDGESEDHIGDITPIGDFNKVRSTITIPLFIQKNQIDEEGSDALGDFSGGKDDLEGKYIKLRPGEKIRVRMFFLRGDNLDPNDPNNNGDILGQLRLRVAPMNGEAKVKNLSTTIKVLNHQVNRVNLPAIIEKGKNYWISNVPANTYFTELSLPGSHQSVGTADQDGQNGTTYLKYQTCSLQEQFDYGVRAFSFQVKDTEFGLGRNMVVFASGKELKNLQDYLKELSNILTSANNNKKREFIVVNIVYKQHFLTDTPEDWYDDLVKDIKDYSTDVVLYDGDLSANTVIGDLAGKILLRIDRIKNTGDLYVNALSGNQPSTGSPYDVEKTFLYWKQKSVLKFYAHDGTSIDIKDNNTGQIDNIGMKNSYVKEVFTKSEEMYKNNGEHNIFFYNNLGGFYCVDNYGGILQPANSEGGDTWNYAIDVNTAAVYELQKRKQDASLGVVLMNYADKEDGSGAENFSRELIQTIINNNFMFELRTDPNKPSEILSNTSRSVLNSNSDTWDN